MKNLFVVPARSGSKGFPHKNIAVVCGCTLLEHAIRFALACGASHDVYVSTDSPEYERIALRAGAKSLGLRSPELSSDVAKTSEVVIDLASRLNPSYDYVVLVQPTSPLRNPADLREMIAAIEKHNADACASVGRQVEPHPFKMKIIAENGFLQPLIPSTNSETPRQLLPAVYRLNGALYVIRHRCLMEQQTFLPVRTIPYLMTKSVNVDTPEDYLYLKFLCESGLANLSAGA